MNFQTLKDLDVKNKTVLLKATLNVPVQDGTVTDTNRIDRLKPTIDYLVSQNAKVLILTYFGRPKGKVNLDFSVRFLTDVLEKCWGTPVDFAESCVGDPVQQLCNRLDFGQVGLLENTRFHTEEENNDPAFTKLMAEPADVYVNDGFPDSHRDYSSTAGLANILPSAAGLLMEAELNALSNALEAPQKPVMAIVGGSKISTKLSVLNNMVRKVDYLVLGGGMANTFMLAQGQEIGNSLCEKDMIDEAQNIMATAKECNCEIVLPQDCVVVDKLENGASHETVTLDNFPTDKSAVDIGETSIQALGSILENCKTVLWNGPMGVFEIKPFDNGTNKVAQKVAELTKNGTLLSVAGGGDTVSALANAGVLEDFSYISTAGGAFLEWIEGKELPGVVALQKAAAKAA